MGRMGIGAVVVQRRTACSFFVSTTSIKTKPGTVGSPKVTAAWLSFTCWRIGSNGWPKITSTCPDRTLS